MKDALVLRPLFASVLVSCLLVLSVPPANAHDRYLWNLGAIGVDRKLHAKTRGGPRGRNVVKVGVIDTLVDCSHPELRGRCKSWTFKGGDYSTWHDHGIHVATTIAANDNSPGETGMVGVAPLTRIRSWGYFADGAESDANETRAINHARNIGVSVINMSYGPVEDADPDVPGQMVMGPNKFKNITSAKNRNIVFVQSAGNEENYYQSMEEPSNIYKKLKNLIIVVSVDRDKDFAYDHSNYPGGACFDFPTCKRENQMRFFTVAAPGIHIEAGYPNGGYGINDGTSMAAPHVTGVVALLHSHWPVLKKRAGATTNIIFNTAQDLGTKGVDVLYGWGLVRADRALSPLGEKYLKKNNKIYPFSTSHLKVTPALSALTVQSVTFFDGYDRDFQIPLATLAPSYGDVLNTWMRDGHERHEYTLGSDSGLSYAFSANGYDPMNPSLADVQWRMSFNNPNGLDWHLGQGVATDRLDSTQALSFGLMADKTHQGGAYPVMALADGGLYGFIDQPVAFGFNLTGGVLTNNTFDSDFDERNFAPKTDAVVVALGRASADKRLSGSLSATYLMEDQGVLGTGGAGGLGFTEGSESQAITLSTSYQLSGNTELSASYTESFSKGNTSTDNLLTLTSSHLVSNAFAIGVAQRHLISDTDELKFSIGQPLRVDGGSMSLSHGDYYDETETMHSRRVDIDLKPTGRQIDYQLQYNFSPKKHLTVGAFAYYANDYLHQENLTDHGVGVRLTGSF